MRIRCIWCGKPNRTRSDWEQYNHRTQAHQPLCVRCANNRLRNPWNALLPMRRIEEDTP
jgi:hypothetical protein